MKEVFFTGLDLGSHAIRIAIVQQDSDGVFRVVGSAQQSSAGISKGSVVSIEDTVSVLSQSLESAERMLGRSITHLTVGVSGSHILTQETSGVIAVSRADGEIKEDDVDRAIEAAQAVATPPNYDILHIIPLHFAVDNQKQVKDPVGMSGVRLEVTAQIVLGLSSEVRNITKAVYRTGVEIDDLTLGILACSESVLSKQQKDLGVALVSVGSQTTSVAVFENGDMLLAGIIPIGSGHITSDLAIGLRTSIETAERIKLEFGRVGKDVPKRGDIDISKFSDDESEGHASFSDVYKIVDARLEELFDHVNQLLSDAGRAGRLPAGIVFTGGGAQLPGIVARAKDHFRLPARLGYPEHVECSIEKAHSLEFSTAIGLALWDRDWRNSSRSFSKVPYAGQLFGALRDLPSKIKKVIG